MNRHNCIRPIGLSIKKIIAIITFASIITCTQTKPYKSHHRCLDWNFGGWKAIMDPYSRERSYSLQPPVSEPIYHRPQIQATEIHHLNRPNSANYVKKLKGPIQSWLPYYQSPMSDKGEAKVVRYNVRRPSSKYNSKNIYPQYPQYLPTTVLHLKKQPKKLNVYPVPIKNIYHTQPIIYQHLDYTPINAYPPVDGYSTNKQPNIYPPSHQQISLSPKQPYSMVSHNQAINHRPSRPKKKTVAAYIPVVQIPAIEHIPPPAHPPIQQNVKVENLKKPVGGYDQKIIEEHVYQIPNHVLHEIRHEVTKNAYPPQLVQHHPASIRKIPLPNSPSISHVEQSYGPPSNTYVEIAKPQILYEINNYGPDYNQNYRPSNGQSEGPPIIEIPYQMDNYAKAEDAGLFKPLLDKTRQANAYPKVGAIPYKDNDPQNLNVIHLIANQRHLPMVVPITSIHTSNDGSYPIAQNEGNYPIIEKEISSYSEQPQKLPPRYQQQPPLPSAQYNSVQQTENYGMKVEQEKSSYIDDEKVILQQLQSNKLPVDQAYKEQPQQQYVKESEYAKEPSHYEKEQPQYVIHQTYSPIASLPDIPPPPPEIHHSSNNANYDQPQQLTEIQVQQEQVKGSDEYQPARPTNDYQTEMKNEYQVQQMKTNEFPVQQEIKSEYSQQTDSQIKEQPITQIAQITTEYIKQEQPKNEPLIVQQPEQTPVQIQEVQIKDNYPTQDYQVKEEYGVRLPAANYEYVKPNNLPTQSDGSYENGQQQNNDQSYSQLQQHQIESQKTVQHESTVGLKDEEQANIAAYEEARKSILQSMSYTTSGNYQSQQPPVQSYNLQSQYDDGSYHSSYQPPLSTAYDTSKERPTNDYTDDYSNSYESNSNYRIEPQEIKSQQHQIKVSKVYDLPSSNTADKMTISTNNYNLKEEIMTSEEQTNKKNYESLPEKSNEKDEKPINEMFNQKSTSGQKYGERIVYVKSKKFTNLKMVDGNTYLGDTLIYSASSPVNSTVLRRRKIDDNVSNFTKIEVSLNESTTVQPIGVESTTTVDKIETNKSNLTDQEQLKSDTAFVKPISRSELRRIKKLRKEQPGDQLAASASEHEETISQFEPSPDVINLDELKEAEDLKAEDSQLFHAYYGPPDHQPEEGYVRLSVEQFKKIFKDAEIHVLNQDLKSSTNASLISQSENSSTTQTPPAQ